jgi:uncharacterized protein YjbI with pentapeptide repeats
MTVEELLEKYAAGRLEFSGINLAEANLTGAKLTGVNFTKANLSIANLSGANLSEANLSYAKMNVARLSGVNLSGAILNYASLNVANLIRADLSRAHLRKASLVRAELIRADFSRADLSEAILSSADLREATLRQASLRRANLIEANLRGCSLREANLEMANLNSANLTSSDLSGVNLRDSELRQANLCLSNLSGADLSGANLRWADLRGANLRWTDLSGAKLSGANLTGADLSHANLTNASLVHANLTQAKLVKLEWMGADLSGAMLTSAKLYSTPRFGLKTEGISCEWVDLSPKGDRSVIQNFTPEELREFFNATPPTIRIVIDAPLEHEASFVLAGTYYQIAQEYPGLAKPPSIDLGSRKTIFTFRIDSDEALLPTAYMAILPFKDGAATQQNIYTILNTIRKELGNKELLKTPHLIEKLTLQVNEATHKAQEIQRTKKYLEMAAKLAFFKACTQTTLTNSSAQNIIIYDHPQFGKRLVKQSYADGANSEESPSETSNLPSLKMMVDFIRGFY